jgi:tetratricopeptide (TPR) repeat protein
MLSRTFKKISFLFAMLVALLPAGCATPPTEQRIDNIPMYGQPQLPRSEPLRKADEDFIAQASSGFGGNRNAASDAWWKQAEEYVANRNLDFAMRRYNQAWLLNPSSYKPYWGFGRVMLERGEVDDAIKHLDKAKQLCTDTSQRPALVSDIGTAYSIKAGSTVTSQASERERYLALSNDNYREATTLDPNYANAWRRWAMALYEEAKYAESWEKVKRAQALNATPFPPAFLTALAQKMPQPR